MEKIKVWVSRLGFTKGGLISAKNKDNKDLAPVITHGCCEIYLIDYLKLRILLMENSEDLRKFLNEAIEVIDFWLNGNKGGHGSYYAACEANREHDCEAAKRGREFLQKIGDLK